jgi:uncharacterized membrane protein YbjE (DUF340 family)
MGLGMLLGFLMRRKILFFSKVERWISLTIYLLLFLLGLTVGKNDVIVRNIHLIGMDALIITLAAIAGSVVLCWFVYHLFYRKKKIES